MQLLGVLPKAPQAPVGLAALHHVPGAAALAVIRVWTDLFVF